MVQNQEAIGAVITAENGKPYGEGKGEVGYSASFCDWASHECRRVHGETMSSPWADRKRFHRQVNAAPINQSSINYGPW